MKKIWCLLFCCNFFSIAWTQSWHSVGLPCVADVGSLVVYKGYLYAGPLSFANPCGNYFVSTARFNGTYWDTTGICDRIVWGNIEEYNGYLYATNGGVLSGKPWPNDFLTNAMGLARWDGTKWEGVDTINNPNGVPGAGTLKYKNDLYIGGSLNFAGGIACKKIVKYDGVNWNNMQGGIDGASFPEVRDMEVYQGDLYVGGEFDIAGLIPCKNLARWNGVQWDSVMGGVIGRVFSMFVDTINNFLYVGGELYYAGGLPVRNIAKWDGVKWDSLGYGFPNVVHGMTMLNGELYVGGGGSTVTDTALAKWDGIKWTPILGLKGGISRLATYKGNIYAGGPHTHFGDSITPYTPTNGLACYGDSCPLNVGIHELNIEKLKFKVYPNPARGEINIEAEENKECIALIYDSIGAKIIEQKFIKQIRISTSDFSKGIYQVQVCDDKGEKCHTEKVIIQ